MIMFYSLRDINYPDFLIMVKQIILREISMNKPTLLKKFPHEIKHVLISRLHIFNFRIL